MQILALLALLVFSSFAVHAGEKLTVVADLWPPYITQEDGKLGGRSTLIVRKILNQAAIPYELQIIPWARAYEMAQSQENVLIFTLVRTEARENQFKWVAELHPNDPTHIFGIGVRQKKLSTLTDAKNHMIAAVRNSMSVEALISKGFKVGENIVLTNDDQAAIRLAEMGRTDFVATSQNTINSYVKRHPYLTETVEKGPNLLDSRLYLAASRMTDTQIVEKLRTAFSVIVKQSPTN